MAPEVTEPEVTEPEVSLNNVFSVENTTCTPPHEKEWHEVSFEYKGQTTIFSLETDGTEQHGKGIPKIHDISELISLQKQCPDFKDIYSYLTGYDLPKDEKLKRMVTIEKEYYDLLDGILIHRYQPRSRKKSTNETFIFQTALPKTLRLKVMQDFHDHNGHFGFKKTYAAIQSKYFWPRMCQDITDYVKSCDRCQRAKKEAHPHSPPLNPLPVAKVFERLHIDLVGPLPKTTAGHEHILVCVDSFSRWVEAFPLHDQSATSIARVLHDEIFCRYGAPISIVSDRGRNFLSKLVNAVCEIYRVSRHKTASYNPRANGCVERQNATIAQTLRMYINKDQNNWHLLLPTILMGIRSTPNTESSGYSPFQMLFGGEMRLPFDTTLIPRETLGPEAKTHVNQLLDRLKVVHEMASKNTEISQSESKEKHDIKAKQSNFVLGEQVFLKINKHRQGYSKKLEDKWKGPYYIREKGPFDTYKIADCQTNKLHKPLVNARHLKRYYDPLNYRIEPTDTGDETDSDAETVIYDPSELVPRQEPPDASNDTTETNNGNRNSEQSRHNRNKNVNDLWFSANKIIRQRKDGQKKQYLIEWSDHKFKPSWQDEEDVSDELKRQFYIKHTRTGKRRKRPYKYFD